MSDMGGAASGRKGSAYERELVNHFDAAGWGALRLPSSGSATDRDLPDVLAGRPITTTEHTLVNSTRQTRTEAWAIELKSGKATTLYADASEVRDLEAFASTWGARPFLAARPTTQDTGREHYLIAPDDARVTDGGAYGLPREELRDRAAWTVGPEGVERL